MSWRRTTALINLLLSSSSRSSSSRRTRAACFVPRSYITSLQGIKDKLSITEQFETSIPRSREFERRFFSQSSRHSPKRSTPKVDLVPLLGNVLFRDPKVEIDPDMKNVVEKVLPSIVEVSCHGPNGISDNFFGVIVDSGGTIITSSRVVDYSEEICSFHYKVDVHPHPKFVTGSFSGKFSLVDRIHDIAIVQCKSDKPLPAIKLANPSNLKAKDKIVCVCTDSEPYAGFPFRFLVEQGKVIISEEYKLWTNIGPQPFNGPMPRAIFNIDGELVGVNAGLSAKLVSQILKFAKKHELPVVPWLGMELKFIRKEVRPFKTVCLVCKVDYKSPAARAGIRVSDIITAFDGKNIRDLRELYTFLYFKSGEDVVVTLKSFDDVRTRKVTLSPDVEETRLNPDALIHLYI